MRPASKQAPPNSDVEADVALSRCAPSGPRSLTPVVRQTASFSTAVPAGYGTLSGGMPELSAPRESTIRKLFALSSNRCAFPDCQTAIVDRSTEAIVGEVCHIRAQREGGPRFDPGQTSEERHSLQNLVLMCGVHHKIIDADENLSRFSAERLQEIKAKHESLAQGAEPDVPLTADAITALLETVRSAVVPTTHMDFRGALLNAGGFGGGPGGGGGGGGIIHIVGVTPS